MPRLYPSRILATDQHVVPDDFNVPNTDISLVLNRAMDQHNVPVDTITTAKIANRTYGTFGNTGSGRVSTGVFSDWYTVFEQNNLLPAEVITLSTNSSLVSGWNKLRDLVTSDAHQIEFSDVKDGILTGYIVVDWERMYSKISGDPGAQSGNGQWISWAVFLDDQLVMETGPLYPRRYTTVLPFSRAVNAGSHVLDIRFKFMINDGIVGDNTAQTLTLYARGIVCQNKIR